MPELANLVISRRRELGTSCGSVLQSISIRLMSSCLFPSTRGKVVLFSFKIFPFGFLPPSLTYFLLSVSHPLSVIPDPTCLRDISLLLFITSCWDQEWVLMAAGASPLLHLHHWLCLAFLSALTASKYFSSPSLFFSAIHYQLCLFFSLYLFLRAQEECW